MSANGVRATGPDDVRPLPEDAERDHMLALVAEHTDNAVAILDADRRIEWVNAAFCRLTGYGCAEVIGLRRAELWTGPFTRNPNYQSMIRALDEGRPADVELPAQTRDGRTYWSHVQLQPVVHNGRATRFIWFEHDVTLRRTAEEQLRATNQQVRALAEEMSAEKALLDGVLASIPHLVYWKDRDLAYSGANPAFLHWRGIDVIESVIERTEDELPVHDELSVVLGAVEPEVLAGGRPRSDLQVRIGPAGARRDLLLSVLPFIPTPGGEVAGVIGVAADVSELGRLERQLAQASRLESIGQLAAGIAHEINTPVQYVWDNTRFVADTVPALLAALRAGRTASGGVERGADLDPAVDLDFLAEEVPAALAQSQEGLQRVSEIVRAMKDFSHPGAGRTGADLNRAVESTVKVCRNEWKYVAELVLDLDAELPPVPCYEGEVKQVLLNIIVNAAQAIAGYREFTGDSTLGRITVSTRADRVADEVLIVVGDDGPGISEEIRDRIFDPFFTTKDVGKGTGQGLSMAYAIVVTKHGGRIWVDSSPGHGATFTVALPLTVPQDPFVAL